MLFSLQIPVSMAASYTFKIFLTTEQTGKCYGFQLQKTKVKLSKPPYFASGIAVLNLMAKVYMFQISTMDDTEVCEPKE